MEWNSWLSYLKSMSEFSVTQTDKNVVGQDEEALNDLLEKVSFSHRWFTREFLDYAMNAFISNAAKNGPGSSFPWKSNGKVLGFWMRPLSPFDGLDLLLLSLNAGYRCFIRSSETDAILYKGIIEMLQNRFPYLKGETEFIDHPFGDVDGWVIAGEAPTNTQLAYFEKKPVFVDTVSQYHTMAVLTGEETPAQLDALADDLCVFFGRSKYSISKIVVPSEYDFSGLLKSLESYKQNGNHSGYFNHYEYRKAACIVSGEPFIDNGFMIIKKEIGESHNIGVVNYTEYRDDEMLQSAIMGCQLGKAQPETGENELIFGNACKRNFCLAGKFMVFLSEIC